MFVIVLLFWAVIFIYFQSILRVVDKYLPASRLKVEYFTCTNQVNPGHVVATQKIANIFFSKKKKVFKG